jgi:hypothetical protein
VVNGTCQSFDIFGALSCGSLDGLCNFLVVKVVEVMTVVEDKELSIKEKKKFERKKFREYSLNVERQ